MPEDVLTPPGVSASSESSVEEPQRIPYYGSTQKNQHLPSVQLGSSVCRIPTPEGQQAKEQWRAMQAVKDITAGQPTPTPEESQMYDSDGQFDDTLGLALQLRNRVSDPGTPPVRAFPRTSGYGGGTRGATANIGSGPGLYTVTKDAKGNGMVKVEELPSQQKEERAVPPTPQPRPQKTQTTKSMVDQTSLQEVRRQADSIPSGEGAETRTPADPRNEDTRRELVEPTPYGPPKTEDVRPQCLDFNTNTSTYLALCQICGSPDHQTDYCQGGR